MHKSLAKALLRSLLRSSRRLEVSAAASGVPSPQLLEFAGFPRGLGSGHTCVRRFISSCFHRSSPEEKASLAIDAALSALKKINYVASLPTTTLSALLRGRPLTLAFTVGTVVKHRESGYRGVVTGWTRECQAGETFRERNGITSTPSVSLCVCLR